MGRPAVGLLVVLIALSAGGPVATAQDALYSVRGSSPWDGFGVHTLSLGDLDGDGIRDVAVAAVGRVVRVLSGVDGSELHTLRGSAGFGLSLAGGDLTGDGVPDVAVGTPLASGSPREAGRVDVHSGADGARVFTMHGDRPDEHLGEILLGVGDRDGDGCDDLLVGSSAGCRMVSGSDGVDLEKPVTCDPILTDLLQSEGTSTRIGGDLAARTRLLGDFDGDGRADWAGSVPFDEDGGRTRVYSSHDGRLLLDLVSGRDGDGFGWSFADAGDVDGDAIADIVVGAPGDDARAPDAGAVYVFSGRTGNRLFVLTGDHEGERLGGSVGSLGDADGDGRADIYATGLENGFGVLKAFASPSIASSPRTPLHVGPSGSGPFAGPGY